MSDIFSASLPAALAPIQSEANESLRARRTQIRKNQHHAEDVQELDDTAVDSISDHSPDNRDGRQQPGEEPHRPPLEERLDIQSLTADATAAKKPAPPTNTAPSHLDISA